MEYLTGSSAKIRLLRQLFTAIENENVEEVRTLISQLGGYVNDIRPDDDDSDDGVGNINNYVYGGIRTPLHEAFLSGNIEILKLFAEATNVDMNVEDDSGSTVLHLAVEAGNTEVLKLLVKAPNIDVDLEDGEGYTALQYVLERKNFDEAKILIDAGADVNTKSYYNSQTAFLLAIEENNASFAEYLLSRGADINYRVEDYWYRSLLHLAADKCANDSHSGMIQVLLKNGADVNVQDCRGNTALHILLEKRTNNKTVKFLMDSKADINLTDSNGEAPLINAIRDNNKEAIKMLLDQGCDVKSINPEYKSTLLHCAARESRSGDFLFDMFEVLLKLGADVNAQTTYGYTPFHYLLREPSVKTVQLFLDFGANVHVKHHFGETPLFNAVRSGNPEVAQLLIDYGSDVSIVNTRGENSLFNAAESGSLKVVQILLNHGIDVNIINSRGETPLFNAVKGGNVEVVQLLIDEGININVIDNQHKNALFNAAEVGKVEVARVLINEGIDVNFVDSLGENPLFNAVKSKNFETVKLLLSHSSNVNKVNINQGWTPLHLAAWYHETPCEIFKCLLKAGANPNACDPGREIPLLTLLNGSSHSPKSSFEKKLRFLLKYSDINIINRKGNHVLGSKLSESAKKIYLEHVAKLKVLNVPLSQSILNIILNQRCHKDYFLRCTLELDAAKNVKLENSWVTFFNLVMDDRRKLKNYAGNANLIEEFEKSDYLNEFPIYGLSMERNISKGIKRRKLFDQSSIILSNNLPILNPNHLIIRDIFDYLATKELSKFCEGN